jgi:hypothetical protein
MSRAGIKVRARRYSLHKVDFAKAPEAYSGPTDLNEGTWQSIVTLPDNVGIQPESFDRQDNPVKCVTYLVQEE